MGKTGNASSIQARNKQAAAAARQRSEQQRRLAQQRKSATSPKPKMAAPAPVGRPTASQPKTAYVGYERGGHTYRRPADRSIGGWWKSIGGTKGAVNGVLNWGKNVWDLTFGAPIIGRKLQASAAIPLAKKIAPKAASLAKGFYSTPAGVAIMAMSPGQMSDGSMMEYYDPQKKKMLRRVDPGWNQANYNAAMQAKKGFLEKYREKKQRERALAERKKNITRRVAAQEQLNRSNISTHVRR